MTQEEFGKTIGLLQKSISRFETGKTKNIPKEYLFFMYKHRISVDWLMGWSDIMFISDKKELSMNIESQKDVCYKELEEQKEKNEKLSEQIKELEEDKASLIRLLSRSNSVEKTTKNS